MIRTVRDYASALRGVGAVVILLLSSLGAWAQGSAASERIVADVLLEGNRRTPSQYIMDLVRTRPGSAYDPDVLQDDVRSLYKTQLFGNVVVKRKLDPKGDIIVTFVVVEHSGRIEEIVFKGNEEFDDRELLERVGLRKGGPMNRVVNKVAAEEIVRFYNEKGYPFTSCTLSSGNKASDTNVVFAITEGPAVFVRSVDVSVTSPHESQFVRDGRLKAQINSKKPFLGIRKFGKPFSPVLVQLDVDKLIGYYKSFGYHDVRVSVERKYSEDNRSVDLVYHIWEGERYRVRKNPEVTGKGLGKSQVELAGLTQLKGGEFYNEQTVNGDVQRITDQLGFQGRKARVTEQVVYTQKGEVDIVYDIEALPPARVGDIFIKGNSVTKQNVILREVPLFPGQTLTYPSIREGERNLARLGIFEMNPQTGVRPRITVLDRGDNEFKDILIDVQETRTGSLLFGVGFNSDAGATGSIVLNERNFDIFNVPTSFDELLSGRAFRGAGQEFRLEAIPGTELQRYTISFREPYLFDTDFTFGASGYYYTRRFNEYDERRAGSRITFGRRLGTRWSASTAVRVENVTVRNVPFFAPVDFTSVQGGNFLTGVRLSATRDDRDSIIRATEGSLFRASVEGVFGDFNFPRVEAEFNQYFTVRERADGSGRHVIVFRNQIGYVGPDAPVFERYYAGGFRTLRGFEFRGVGPDVNGFKVGGDFMLLNSAEYQIPLDARDQFLFVAFVDGGTVERRFEITDYRMSVGFGLRLTVPFLGQVPIALDFAFPVIRNDLDREQIFNFYLGSSF